MTVLCETCVIVCSRELLNVICLLSVCYLFVVWYLFAVCHLLCRVGARFVMGIGGTEGIVSSVVLTPVTQSGYWRVKIARPKVSPRYVGKFRSREEAEKWIEKHCWPTKQTREPDEP